MSVISIPRFAKPVALLILVTFLYIYLPAYIWNRPVSVSMTWPPQFRPVQVGHNQHPPNRPTPVVGEHANKAVTLDDQKYTRLISQPPIRFPYRKANGTFVILARNTDLAGTVRSIREIEDRFNRRYQYPYVFLNDEPFDEKFQRSISILTDAKVEFGLIPGEHWNQPEWIDEDVAKSWRDWMVAEDIIYGGSVSYRNMCRFNSGFFFRHSLMEKYRWYWRVEPDVHFHCDIDFDPFLYMEDNNKVYGFTISMYEYESTIMSLWNNVREFANLYPHYMAPNNSLEFISEDGGETYNLCHFWSNFEIADLDFWRGPEYQKFFEFLEWKGGFYYERWGDAPVHSIAAALFLNRTQLHFFDEIGYEHPPYTHCPKRGNNWGNGRCTCDPEENFDDYPGSCLGRWEAFINGTLS